MDKKSVVVYSTSTCPYCNMAKEFLKEHKIDFKEVDVGVDQEAAKALVEKTGQMGVPVIEIEGKFIIGFDKEKVMEALGIKE